MSDEYEVGFGKPPKHSQFKKGQSGNPKGRKKGTRNFKTDLKKTLDAKVTITVDGCSKQVSSQFAALQRLREKALKGDARSLDRYLDLAAANSAEQEAQSEERSLSSDEIEILADFERRVRNKAAPSRTSDEDQESDHAE